MWKYGWVCQQVICGYGGALEVHQQAIGEHTVTRVKRPLEGPAQTASRRIDWRSRVLIHLSCSNSITYRYESRQDTKAREHKKGPGIAKQAAWSFCL